jgi:streptogramin lyase
MQVFDENGKFIMQWPFATPSSVNFLFIGADRQVWAFDDTTSKVVKYDPEGHLLYAWGALGDYPGGLFNMHGASVDQEGNLYVAEVANGRVQKFRPRPGANPAFLVSKPVYSAWK